MLYDIQSVVKDKDGVPGLQTDTVSGSKRRIFDRVKELNKPSRRQQCRVVDQQGRILDGNEIHEMR
jgi:hypothetical protein